MHDIDIFISYSSKDVSIAAQIFENFKRQRWNVWWDSHIIPGQYFDEVIDNAISSSSVVVVLWSSFAAKSMYVRAEIHAAMSTKHVIPVKFDATKLPLPLRIVEAVDLTDWVATETHAELEKLLNAISSVLQKPVLDYTAMPSSTNAFELGWYYEKMGKFHHAALDYIRAIKIDSHIEAEKRLLGLIKEPLTHHLVQAGSEGVLGTVTEFFEPKGFGFISPDIGGLPVFVHVSAVEKSGYKNLVKGQRVTFAVQGDKGKFAAVNIKVL